MKEFYDMKEETKNSNDELKSKLYIKIILYYIVILLLHYYIILYCLKCRKNTERKNPKVVKTKNGRIMIFIKMCSVSW